MSGPMRGGAGAPPDSSRRNRRRTVVAAALALIVVVGGFLAATAVRDNNREVPVAVTSPDASTPAPDRSDTPTEAAPAQPQGPAATEPPDGEPAPSEQPGPAAGEAAKATQELPVAEPVAIDGGSAATGGVDIRVTSTEAVDGEARGIGEIAGPSVRFTVSIANGGKDPVDLSSAVITVEAGADRLPCSELSGPDSVPFPAVVNPGETATGKFVFLIPVESRGDVSVFVNFSVDTAVAAFQGQVS